MTLSPQIFTGEYVTLHPLNPEADSEALYAVSNAAETAENLWRFMPCGPFENAFAMRDYLRKWQEQKDVQAFTVRDVRDDSFVGSISLMNIRPEHRVAELGNIWYIPAVQRTKVNTESNFLLLRYCFEELGYRRMEWKCNALNEPSRRAALRLGYRFEGIFHQHMMVKGKNRDTAWYAMLDYEWPGISEAMSHWLYRDDSAPLGGQTSPVEP